MTHPCPTHGNTIRWSDTSYGRRGQCNVAGCTVACWDKPTSLPGDQETRELRHACHGAFDPLWKEGHFRSRSEAYRWLGKALRIPKDLTHIGMLTKTQCEALIIRLNALWEEIDCKESGASQIDIY